MTILISSKGARTLAVLDAIAIPCACLAAMNMLHIRAGVPSATIIALLCLRSLRRIGMAFANIGEFRYDTARLTIGLAATLSFLISRW